MNERDDYAAADSALPADTTPTWEMELLVSGATTFGLLQLPSLLDHAYFFVASRAGENLATWALTLWIYAKVSLITLIITFIIHLCLRGYWVALVGLNSVYPGGVRWQNLRMGPIARAISERSTPTMSASIEIADNRATRVFGTGFGLAMLMLLPLLLVSLGLLITLPVEAAFGARAAAIAFSISVAVIVIPWALAVIVDRRIGSRLSADSPVAKMIGRVIGFYSRLGFDRRNNLLIALFLSHTGGMRGRLAVMMMMVPILAIVMVPMLVAERKLPLGHLAGLLDTSPFAERSAPAHFYASLEPDRSVGMPQPYIADRVARDAYLPLFVPYVPSRLLPAMRNACPEIAATSTTNVSRAGLDCLAIIADIRIDGAAVKVDVDASTDPQTGQPGFLAMLPMDAVPAGRHELSLSAPATGLGSSAERRYRIPFWKTARSD
jgi:hypothetical protein